MRCDKCKHALERRVKSKKVETFIVCKIYNIPIESCKHFEEVTSCLTENKE